MSNDFDTRADELAVDIEKKIAESEELLESVDFDPVHRRMAEAQLPDPDELFVA
jgi:hypothetical protein